MYAVVRAGGKQIRVEAGDQISIEKIEGAPGDQVELADVLLIGGDTLLVGTPLVEGARVVAPIEGESRGPKLRIMKFKRRKRYRVRQGHRQTYTTVRIDAIEA